MRLLTVSAMDDDTNAELHRHFIDQIRRRAKRRKLSLNALARDAGLARSGLNCILAGTSTPKLETIFRLAEVLGCRPSKLLP